MLKAERALELPPTKAVEQAMTSELVIIEQRRSSLSRLITMKRFDIISALQHLPRLLRASGIFLFLLWLWLVVRRVWLWWENHQEILSGGVESNTDAGPCWAGGGVCVVLVPRTSYALLLVGCFWGIS